jgi:hypothetical protein
VLHLPICAADTQLSRAHSTRCLHPTIPSTASTALDEGIPVLADGRCKVATCTLMGFTHQRRLSFQSDCIQDPFKVGDMFFTYFALTQTFTYYHVTECGLVVRLGDSIQAHQNNSQTLFNKIHRFWHCWSKLHVSISLTKGLSWFYCWACAACLLILAIWKLCWYGKYNRYYVCFSLQHSNITLQFSNSVTCADLILCTCNSCICLIEYMPIGLCAIIVHFHFALIV